MIASEWVLAAFVVDSRGEYVDHYLQRLDSRTFAPDANLHTGHEARMHSSVSALPAVAYTGDRPNFFRLAPHSRITARYLVTVAQREQ